MNSLQLLNCIWKIINFGLSVLIFRVVEFSKKKDFSKVIAIVIVYISCNIQFFIHAEIFVILFLVLVVCLAV